jgi:hypothetical protein
MRRVLARLAVVVAAGAIGSLAAGGQERVRDGDGVSAGARREGCDSDTAKIVRVYLRSLGEQPLNAVDSSDSLRLVAFPSFGHVTIVRFATNGSTTVRVTIACTQTSEESGRDIAEALGVPNEPLDLGVEGEVGADAGRTSDADGRTAEGASEGPSACSPGRVLDVDERVLSASEQRRLRSLEEALLWAAQPARNPGLPRAVDGTSWFVEGIRTGRRECRAMEPDVDATVRRGLQEALQLASRGCSQPDLVSLLEGLASTPTPGSRP